MSGGSIAPSASIGTSLVAKGNSRANGSTGDASEGFVASSQALSLDDLRDAASVRCTFGPGNGASWPNGKLTVGDAAWQGGPVELQSINYDAGTSRCRASDSFTDGWNTRGRRFVRLRCYIYGARANGTLTVISVFGNFDNAGHHRAVMSLHDGNHQIDIAQFYGGCDSTQKSLNAAF